MRRVLIVSYDFPPSSIGIWRTVKFCKYMGDFGWQPAVLTVRDVRTPRWDPGPLREVPPTTEVRRTESLDTNRLAWVLSRGVRRGGEPSAETGMTHARPTNELFRRVMNAFRAWVLVPDDRAGWIPFAMREGRRWLREQKFDAVYSTSFPNSAHVVGERLAREAGLPYVADFRDIWIGNYYFYYPATAWHDRRQRAMESRVVERAARVVSVTQPITQDFRERYPGQAPDKFVTIPNGFDPPDFEFAAPIRIDNDHFTITYAGTMYGSTSPEAFLEAVRRLLDRRPEWRDVLRLRFVGSMIEPYRRMIEEKNLPAITRIDNYLAHEEALGAMAAADGLLLIVSPARGSHIMLTQKVFEYAAARRPIIGLVPQGAARDFLAEINEGPIIAPDDVAGIEAALESMLCDWRQRGRASLGENAALDAYRRRDLTRRLCEQLDIACRSQPAGVSTSPR